MQSYAKQTMQSSEQRELVKRQSELELVTEKEVLYMGFHENFCLLCVGEGKAREIGVSSASPKVQKGPT